MARCNRSMAAIYALLMILSMLIPQTNLRPFFNGFRKNIWPWRILMANPSSPPVLQVRSQWS
jgi:hypothetical protein